MAHWLSSELLLLPLLLGAPPARAPELLRGPAAPDLVSRLDLNTTHNTIITAISTVIVCVAIVKVSLMPAVSLVEKREGAASLISHWQMRLAEPMASMSGR